MLESSNRDQISQSLVPIIICQAVVKVDYAVPWLCSGHLT